MISKKTFLTVFAISIALIFLMAPVASGSHSITPAASTSTVNYQPDPTLNTNVSWSTFYHGWNATEYNNGTGNKTLNAGLSTFYANPIAVNPADIQANGTLTNDKLGSATYIWENTTYWVNNSYTNDSSYSKLVTSGSHLVTEADTSPEAATSANYEIEVPVADFPSNNIQYDYVTIIYGLSGNAISGVQGSILMHNSTGKSITMSNVVYPGQIAYMSVSLASIEKNNNYKATFNTTGSGATSYVGIMPYLAMPASTTTEYYNLTVYGLAFTYYPLTLGTNSTGSVINRATGSAYLSSFSPSFPWTSVDNSGYSVAVSASPNNLSQVQTPITSGNYIEQVQYSGAFQFPTSPYLSYSTANITFPLTVPASQIQVLTLGGTSYINTLGNKTNGTVQLISSVNPTSPTSYYAIVDYTASQWQSISHPAGFFTYDGIAYYYWLAIGAIASLLGLGVGVRHAKTKREQTEKVDRITRRGR